MVIYLPLKSAISFNLWGRVCFIDVWISTSCILCFAGQKSAFCSFLPLKSYFCRFHAGHANFGTFEIDWDANPVIIDANVRDIHGNPVLGETIKLSELQPGYFKSQAVRGRHVKRHCTLESELPWYRKYILAITFIGTLTGKQSPRETIFCVKSICVALCH